LRDKVRRAVKLVLISRGVDPEKADRILDLYKKEN